MRTLRLVVRRASAGEAAVIALATLVPAATSCGARSDLRVDPTATGDGGAGATGPSAGGGPASSSSTGSGGFDPVTTVSSSSTGGSTSCDALGGFLTELIVEVPPPGTPANPGQICMAMGLPVQSNEAARVTLTKFSPALHLATGFVELAPSLANQPVFLDAIKVIEASQAPALLGMQVSNVQTVAGGFTFDASWQPPLDVQPFTWAQMTVQTELSLVCPPNELKPIVANTIVHLCLDDAGMLEWVSSGDECKACEVIAEMAPSPIVPDKTRDELPLARAVRLRVVPIARVGRTVVLLAENDGGPDVAYSWHASGGDVLELAPDLIVWTLPAEPGPHLVQAAIESDDAAAVASFTWKEAA